jgi:DNA invertase Pin-like site-specific DNA recombinase
MLIDFFAFLVFVFAEISRTNISRRIFRQAKEKEKEGKK